MRRWCLLAVMLLTALVQLVPPTVAQVPSGFSDILKNVERGKRFHEIWPPIVGQSPLGDIVRANDPKKIMGTFESIESAEHRIPAYEFRRGETRYITPELEKKKDGGFKVDIGELLGVLKPANSGDSTGASSVAAGAPTTGTPSAGGTGAKPSEGTSEAKEKALTGVDWATVSEVRRSGGDIAVEWYSLGTLQAVGDGTAVNGPARALLKDNDSKTWFRSRVLRFDGLSYELKAKNKFAAGFASGIVKWIPGISISRATDTHIMNRTGFVGGLAP